MGRFKRGRGTPHHPYAEPEQIDFCFQIINKMWLNKGLRRSEIALDKSQASRGIVWDLAAYAIRRAVACGLNST